MTSIQLIACLGMIAGGFLLLGIRPIEFTDGLFGFLAKEPENIRNEIHTATKKKKARFLKKAIIEAHDGTIEVESGLGEGTVFRVSFLIPTKL